MPQGKGTYGNQVGRPSKSKSMANGDPKKKVKSAGKFQSRAEAKANIKAFGKGEGRGKGAIMSDSSEKRDETKKAKKAYKEAVPGRHRPAPRPESDRPLATDTSQTAPERSLRSMKRDVKAKSASPINMNYGPRSEGKRGKGTGWAN
jgi:hypothetical protein